VLRTNDFSYIICKGYAPISEFSDKTHGWMPSDPSDLFTFSFFNLVAILTKSKLIFGMLDKVSFVSLSNGALFSTT